jgi:hypothetical protein
MGEDEVTASGTMTYTGAGSSSGSWVDGDGSVENGHYHTEHTYQCHLTAGGIVVASESIAYREDKSYTIDMDEASPGYGYQQWITDESFSHTLKNPLFLDLRYGAVGYCELDGTHYKATDVQGVTQFAPADLALLHYRSSAWVPNPAWAANYACAAVMVSPWTQVVDRQRAPSTYYYPLAVYAQPYDDQGNSVVYTEIETLHIDQVAGDADQSVTVPIAFATDFALDEVWQAHAAAYHSPNKDNGEEPFTDTAAASALKPHGRL